MAFGAAFLSNPAALLAHPPRESWGENEAWIDFSGGPYRFGGLSAAQEQEVRVRFRELCPPANPASPAPPIDTRLFRIEAGDFKTFDRTGWRYTLDFAHHPDMVWIAGYQWLARLDWRPRLNGALWVTEDSAEVPFLNIFENYFRALAAYSLLDRGGILLHSAGVTDAEDERFVHIFVGHSGAGKSTTARLAQASGRTVLSDDLNAVLVDGEQIVVERLPFSGELGQTPCPRQRYRLKNLWQLEKSDNNAVVPIREAGGMAKLFGCAPFVNTNPHRADQLLATARILIGRCPMAILQFTPDGRFWPLLNTSSKQTHASAS